MAAVDYFLKLDGIEGESSDDKHKGEIEIESFSWGVRNTASAVATGGAGAGRAQFSGFDFMDLMTKASPQLFLKCATGSHIKTGVLTCRKAGGTQFEFLKLTLSDVLVSSYQTAGAGDVPQDSVSLNFSKIEVSYSTQNTDGQIGSTITSGFDLRQNRVL